MDIEGKRVLVVGTGVSGIAAAELLLNKTEELLKDFEGVLLPS